MNMFLNIVVPAACAVVMCVTPAFAQDHIQYYDHNGSLMKMVWDQEVGEYFEMFYEVPRRGLKVKPGTFFMGGGEPAGGAVYAYPRTFKKGCAPAEYKVTGRFDEAGNLRLGGRAPIRKGCKVVGYATTDNSWLEFTRLN